MKVVFLLSFRKRLKLASSFRAGDNLFVDFSRGVTESFSFIEILWIARVSPLNRWKRFTGSFVSVTSLIHKGKEGNRRKRNRLVLSDQIAIEW